MEKAERSFTCTEKKTTTVDTENIVSFLPDMTPAKR